MELDNIIRCLYEDRVCGRISTERYDTLAVGYEQEQSALKGKVSMLSSQINEMDLREQCIQEFIHKAKEYAEFPKLTPEILRVFIRKIVVYEKLEKYSRTAEFSIVVSGYFLLLTRVDCHPHAYVFYENIGRHFGKFGGNVYVACCSRYI